MVRVVLAVLLGIGGGLCACAGTTVGGEEDGGSGSAGKPAAPGASPAQKCASYASTRCKKSFGCYVEVGRLPQKDLQYNVDQCTKLFVDKLPCTSIASVSGNYQRCLTDIDAMDCSKWNVAPEQFPNVPMPSSCDELLSF